ncbi:unnamed protein product [Prorocentrum cordatum]|uniref:Uncharacterized protein n=1 Tax=Prorocentrum cordatum TaxID=2364126 RepID=A0ABN9X5A2_9DINO|nr:unnamed protein product [Polarella glacialis]
MSVHEDTKTLTDGYYCRPLGECVVTPILPQGNTEAFLEVTTDASALDNPLVHWIDFVTDHADAIPDDLEAKYREASKNNTWHDLPLPFNFKEPLPADSQMQMCILDPGNGAKSIIKHVVLGPKTKMKFQVFSKLAVGSVRKLVFQHPKIGVRVFQYIFEHMGGKQFRQFHLSPEVKQKSKVDTFYEMSDEDIDAGFTYIIKNAPRTTSECAQLVWQTKALKQGAPLHGWPIALVDKALRNVLAEGVLAKKEYQRNLFLCEKHFKPWFLNILKGRIDPLTSLALVGEPNCGKTPVGKAYLFAMCDRNARVHGLDQDKVCIRVTPEIDFLRGEPGALTMGDFVDDGCLNQLPAKMVKALLDVGQFESMCWARWGATKWVKGEPRAVADQTCDDRAVKDDVWPHAKFQEFFDMLRPTFHEKMTPACIMAVFKRAAFIVNTKKWVYWRPAGTQEAGVQRKNIEGMGEYLTEEGKALYGASKNGDTTPPADWQNLLQQERNFIDSAVQAAQARRVPDAQAAPVVRVKRGHLSPDTRKFRRLLGPSGPSIDLCSPSPAKAEEPDMPLTQMMEQALEGDNAEGLAAYGGGMDDDDDE